MESANKAEKVQVSVVIPVYNAEQYLRERLDCLVKQSLKNIEIICVDDGSTDSSLEILKKYAQRDKRVKILTQQNLFAGVARNNGLENAKGEYVIFMDADDFCAEDMLEKLYEKGKKTNAQVVICGGAKYNTAKKEVIPAAYFFNYKLVEGKETFSREDIPHKICTVTVPAPWNKLFKRAFVLEEGLRFQALQNSNDAFFTMSAMCIADRIAYVNENLCYYRIDSEGSIQKKKHKHALNFFAAYGAIYDKLVEKGIYEQVKRSYNDLAISGVAFNVNTITDPEAAETIIDYFVESFNEKTNLLGEPPESYSNKNNYYRVKNVLNHYRFKKNQLRVLENKQVRTLVENTTVNPKVSVIIPVYNVEEYLLECLDSLAQQTLKDIEVICINDGSKDGSLKLCLEYAEKDKRFSVIDQLNSGLSMTRNVGVRHAKGKYIYFIDSDDYLLPQALEELVDKAEKENLQVVFFGADSFGDESCTEVLKRYVEYYHRKGNYDGDFSGLSLLEELLKNEEYRPSACMQLIDREFFLEKKLFFSEGILHEDNIFTFKCLLSAAKAGVKKDSYYQRRIHANSIMTERVSFANTYGYFKCYMEMLDFVKNNSFAKQYETIISNMLTIACQNVRSTYRKMGADDKLTYMALNSFERACFKASVIDYMEESGNLHKERDRLKSKDHEIQRLKKEFAEIKKSLLEANSNVEKASRQLEEAKKQGNTNKKKAAQTKEAGQKLEQAQRAALVKKLEALENSSPDKTALEKENAALKKKLENQMAKYKAMENSVSFKIGRVLTSVPRAIRNILFKK